MWRYIIIKHCNRFFSLLFLFLFFSLETCGCLINLCNLLYMHDYREDELWRGLIGLRSRLKSYVSSRDILFFRWFSFREILLSIPKGKTFPSAVRCSPRNFNTQLCFSNENSFFRISTMQLVKLASEWQMRGETLELTNVMLLYLSKWMLCVVVILLHDGPSSGHVRKHSQATRGVPRSMACI